MSETQKTILIAGGVVVGAFLLMKFLAPAPVVTKSAPSSSGFAGLIGNIAAIGGGLSHLFGGGSDGQVVNTAVQDTPITDAQTDAFTSGHYGVDFSDIG